MTHGTLTAERVDWSSVQIGKSAHTGQAGVDEPLSTGARQNETD